MPQKRKKYVIAFDVGGTKIEAALFDSNFNKLKKEVLFFNKKQSDTIINLSRREVLSFFCGMIDRLRKGYDVVGIGISYPDIIFRDNSIFGLSKIKALRGFNLANYLEKKYKIRSVIANDADCFALAEQRLGAGKGCKNMVGIIVGTGVGCGIIINGFPYVGSVGSGGEFGRNIVNPLGHKDRVGFSGSVESYVGGPEIVKNYLRAGGKIKNITPFDIFASKEEAARKVVADWFKYLGIGLASIVNFLNPEVIVMGGGLSNLPIYQRLNKSTKKYTINEFSEYIKIIKNKLGDSGGIYGAAILICSALNSSR